MIEIPDRSEFYVFVMDGDGYVENEAKNDAESRRLRAEEVALVDVSEKFRDLKGKKVSAVVFSVGEGRPLFWMPSDRFYRLTKEDKKRTSTPFDR